MRCRVARAGEPGKELLPSPSLSPAAAGRTPVLLQESRDLRADKQARAIPPTTGKPIAITVCQRNALPP